MRKILCSTSSVVILVVFLLGNVSYAQTGRSSIKGIVRDPQGNLVAGATLTLSDAERNYLRTLTSNESGGYVFSAIPPGTYKLEVEAPGFKKVSVAEVKAPVDTTVDVDVNMEVGNVSEVVNVTSGAEAPLNTSDASIGNTFERRRIVDLPLNANNVVGLLSLQPGVTRSGYVNGGRSDQANITLDGVDVNEQQSGLDVITDESFASVLRMTRDSLQEFRVTTTNPNADQGRSSGAQVSLITRSGSNEWHGSLYETHRNTATTANDFFSNAAGRFTAADLPVQIGQAKVGDQRVPRSQLLRNVFGGSIGGPIKKNRAYFFFNYEGLREASATPVVREVPLPTLGRGIVRYRTDSGASDSGCPPGTPAGVECLTPAEINAAYDAANGPGTSPGINPAALAVLAAAAARYPVNDTSVGDGLNTGGFRFNAKTPAKLNTYIARFDFNLTDRQNLFVRGNYQNDLVTHNAYGGPDCGIDFSSDNIQCLPDTPPLTVWNHPKGLAAGHTWSASNTFINRFTYGFTRASFTDFGDSNENRVGFRFIFQPAAFNRTLRRTTPVHNFVDDVSWTKGNHSFGFGANARLIRNNRIGLNASFDEAVINPSYYNSSGRVLTNPFSDFANRTDLRDALASVIGRYSQYSANLVYDKSGALKPVGTPTDRSFATEEYEIYVQDSWRIRPSFTVNYGVRWSTSTPVYERNGLQVRPTPSLGEYFNRRVESSAAGVPFNDPITFDLAGKANKKPGYYKQDWNNFAPSVSFAWSPDFGKNFISRLIGRNGKSVVRGGFRMTYDRIGSQLAVNFDLNNLAGYTSARNINANTFDVCDGCSSGGLGPLFTGFNPTVRTLPFPGSSGPIPTSLTFPLTVASDEDQRIEISLDDTLKTPYNYNVNFSYGREIGKGLSFEASYVGRFARKLLATRDIMQLNNLKDPQSGMTFYEAMGRLIDARYSNTPITSVANLPYFNNLFPFMPDWWGDPTLTPTQAAYAFIAPPALGGAGIIDYTFVQLLWDDSPTCTTCPFGGGPAKFNNMFYQPQFAALSAFSTVARSNYNAAQFSLRQRFRDDLMFDFNYTYSHSLDNASGLQSANSYGSAFIVNALFPDQNYASSDFDARHIINANWLVGLPFGRGKRFLSGSNKIVDGVLGGWELTGIFRWNSGLPVQTPFDCCVWATNWNVQSNGVRATQIQSTPTGSVGTDGTPNLFRDPAAAYASFRNARSGEVGDRNVLRGQSYISLDAGLTKVFKLPWEGHTLQFRWEVFNVTNTQRFENSTIADLGLDEDPFTGATTPSTEFGKYTSTQTPLNETKAGRVMQFALRYQF